MRFGSLFAGIGGFDLGLERAGMECVWQVEIDPYCQKVLAKHWPQVKRYDDVRECGEHNLETVDLICGGFPCQPHSVAGKRRGAVDDRNLWPEYRRVLAELRPRWVLGENVPGIVTTMLDEVLSDLESEGYAATTIVLPAVAFDDYAFLLQFPYNLFSSSYLLRLGLYPGFFTFLHHLYFFSCHYSFFFNSILRRLFLFLLHRFRFHLNPALSNGFAQRIL